MLKRIVALATIAGLVACASARKGSRCAPIDPELFEDYGGLYDECTVEQRARVTMQPRITYPYQAPNNITCVFAELKMVVDTFGKADPRTVMVTRANDERFVGLMVAALPQVRFAPGKVQGRKVHQIARWEARAPVQSMISTSRRQATSSTSC